MALTEFKSETHHYFRDKFGNIQGEFKEWYSNGQLLEHCFYVDGKKHGECRWAYPLGGTWIHRLYVNGENIGDLSSGISKKGELPLSKLKGPRGQLPQMIPASPIRD